eukprot:scaffold2551_cov376-Prasinococcus_capsulatus_cf.AAC.2
MGAGKSSLVLRFVKGQFFDYQESTIGAAFLTQTVAVNDHTVKFEIWDTAGQERYHSLAPMYYRGAAAAIIVYDVTNVSGSATLGVRRPAPLPFARESEFPHKVLSSEDRITVVWGSQESFNRAKSWVRELQRQGNPNLVMALAGNKADKVAERKVETEVRGRIIDALSWEWRGRSLWDRPVLRQEAQAYADENGLFLVETSAKTAANVNELFYDIARKLPKSAPPQNSNAMRLDPAAETAAKKKDSNRHWAGCGLSGLPVASLWLSCVRATDHDQSVSLSFVGGGPVRVVSAMAPPTEERPILLVRPESLSLRSHAVNER